MKAHWLYLKYVVRHKWYVFWACFYYGLYWRGLKHDWTKFLPSEWFPYVEYFYGEKIPSPSGIKTFKDGEWVSEMVIPEQVQQAFDRAWNYHQKRNSHHWQFWLLSPDNPRPNFTHQSYDGGMSHGLIRRVDGSADAALVYDTSVEWFKPNWEAVKQLEFDLDNTPVALEMPLGDVYEMLADWRGAGMALGKPNTWEWYRANEKKIFLHPKTREIVEREIRLMEQSHRVGVMLGFEHD